MTPEAEAWPVELREHTVQCRHVSCRVRHWNVNGYCDAHPPTGDDAA